MTAREQYAEVLAAHDEMTVYGSYLVFCKCQAAEYGRKDRMSRHAHRLHVADALAAAALSDPEPECSCAMTEATLRTCPVHGEDQWRALPDPEQAVREAWPFGAEQAAQVIAAVSWPNEREENRDGWAVKMLTDADLFDKEATRARDRLEAAITAVREARP